MKLVKHLDILPHEFAMIGNSQKSDVLPVLQIGGHGFQVPYHTTWAHERIEHTVVHENFKELKHIGELIDLIHQLLANDAICVCPKV